MVNEFSLDKYSSDPAVRKQAKQQQQQQQTKLHIIRLHLNIGDADLERSLNQAKKFLDKRNHVKVVLQLRGREKSRPQNALDFLVDVTDYLKDYGNIQTPPSMNNLSALFTPFRRK